MTLPVPLEAAKSVRAMLTRGGLPLPAGALIPTSDLIPLIEFAEQFEPKPLPRMTVNVLDRRPPDREPGDDWQDVATLEVPAMAGELNEIRLEDGTIDPMRFDLIRLNGRTYAPEVIEAIDDDEPELSPELAEFLANPVLAAEKLLAEITARNLGVAEAWEQLVGRNGILEQLDEERTTVSRDELADFMRHGLLRSLHTAGNGQELTLADVNRVAEGLEQFDPEDAFAAGAVSDGARLIRFLVDVVIAERDAEIADLRTSVIAFAGPFAAEYARDRNWPAGHMAAHHFDILERAGARMVDFVRHVEPGAVA